MIPLSVPNISGNEWKYVQECLDDGWVSYAGGFVERFENEFANYIGCKHAVAVTSGTAALHISLILCGVEQGDEVLVPNLTFVAPVNTVRYSFANPVFMDSEWTTLGLDVEKIRDFLEKECEFKNGFTYNKNTGSRVKAIIPMHTLGYPVDMNPLLEICEKFNIDVIEDATESLGSEYMGKKTGNFGKFACFSFNGNKIMTTGGGGMITTNDEQLAKRAKHLTTTAKTDPIEYEHDEVAYNYRLTNVSAAIGVAQLELLDEFVETKRKNLIQYKELIEPNDNFYIHTEVEHSKSNYWMYSLVRKDNCEHSVMDIVRNLADNQIQARPIWKLMNLLPMFNQFQSYQCHVSQEIYERVVSIPCSTNLSEREIEKVADVIKSMQYK
ncbi:MAG: aminotransferase DegT [Flavobacteriales bacterium]|nr:MAG: aminotransferase DegT [Flavobacteriales bacterium]